MYGEGGMFVHGVKLMSTEPDETLVQRRLECCLDPGWCFTAPPGSELKVSQMGKYKVWRIAGVLTLLWLLWLVTSYPRGGLIHSLFALAIAVGIISLVRRWRPIVFATKVNRVAVPECPPALIDPDDLARFEGEGGLEALEPDRADPHERLMLVGTIHASSRNAEKQSKN